MTKDPIEQIKKRYLSVAYVSTDAMIQDIQNLLALVRACEKQLTNLTQDYACNGSIAERLNQSHKRWIEYSEEKSKIFGDKS